MKLAFALLAILLVCVPRVSRADGSCVPNLLAPIETPNLHPLAALHLSYVPASSLIPPSGCTTVRLSGSISNTVNGEDESYLIDAESRETALELSHTLASGVELTVRQKLLYRGGGFSDGLIESWHELFGFPNGPRSRLDEDDYDISGENEQGETFRLAEHGTGLGDLELEGKLALPGMGFDSSALRLAARAPTGEDGFGSDGVDIGLSLLSGLDLGRIGLSFGAGVVVISDDSESGIVFSDTRETLSAHFAGALWDRFALVFGVLVESKLVDNIRRFPNYQVYLDSGVRYALSSSSTLELTVRENPTPDDGTTDFSTLVAIRSQI